MDAWIHLLLELEEIKHQLMFFPLYYQPERSGATSLNLSYAPETETQLSRRPFTVTHLRRSSREGGGGGGRSKDTVSSSLSCRHMAEFFRRRTELSPSFVRVWAILPKMWQSESVQRCLNRQVLCLFIYLYLRKRIVFGSLASKLTYPLLIRIGFLTDNASLCLVNLPCIVANLTSQTVNALHLTAEYFKISQLIVLDLHIDYFPFHWNFSTANFSGGGKRKRVSTMRARGNIPTSVSERRAVSLLLSLSVPTIIFHI